MIGCSTPRRISSRGLHRIGIGARIELDCKNSTVGDAWKGGRLAGMAMIPRRMEGGGELLLCIAMELVCRSSR